MGRSVPDMPDCKFISGYYMLVVGVNSPQLLVERYRWQIPVERYRWQLPVERYQRGKQNPCNAYLSGYDMSVCDQHVYDMLVCDQHGYDMLVCDQHVYDMLVCDQHVYDVSMWSICL